MSTGKSGGRTAGKTAGKARSKTSGKPVARIPGKPAARTALKTAAKSAGTTESASLGTAAKAAAGTAGKTGGKVVGVTGKSGGARDMRVKVKKAGKLKHSSQLWLERQLNDPYVKRAREMGYRSRAAFKIEEMDDRFKFLKSGQKLIDLGCAPGGWCQIAAMRVGLEKGKGRIVGIDLLPVDPIPGVDLIEMDFMADEAPALLTQRLGGRADGVMSDMAANTTGHKKTDHLKIIALAEAALEFTHTILAPGGFFLAKLFQGGESAELLAQLKRDFTTVRNLKPGASRSDSSELYVLATGFRRKAETAQGDEAAAPSEG
ncbi:RlmE family RNA methyltransferase [Bosea sp. (in: a-proteobacteria)]|jgi:23S rRNA (uridine2552-2'-O)-methyltransferase|uniref:RlmE family RNA methyltransferase n=1 Tax=Bosea sp. (in: a-proteobacteria) TaxID=1871050 RepID=UPI00356697BB